MAKKKYEVVTKGLTVFGAHYGEIVELDEETAERFVKMRYLEPSRKKKADVKAETAKVKKAESGKLETTEHSAAGATTVTTKPGSADSGTPDTTAGA